MDKLRMTSPDLTDANIGKIAELFPTVITETTDTNGNVTRAVDFDLLRQELSDHIVEGPQERYRLDWPGKRQAAFAANTPIAKTLRPVREKSIDFDTTKNIFIEGDNLDALKLLQESYLGRVGMIYIDPPYNTGSDSLTYPDNYGETTKEYLRNSGQISPDEVKLQANPETNGRHHSDWLTMMYPRLKLARNLLKDSGLAFISIDENEVSNLLSICEEIFGRKNVLGALPVVMNLKGNQDAFGFAESHEFIVVCFRNKEMSNIGTFPVDEENLLAEWKLDEYGLFKEADNLRATGVNSPRSKRPNLWYPVFIDSTTGEWYITDNDKARRPADEIVWPVNPDGEELSWYWSKKKFQEESYNLILKNTSNGWQFYKKQRPKLGDIPTKKPKSFLFKPSYSTSTATKRLKDLLGGKYFTGPKPVPFIEDLLTIGSSKDDIVVDFFSGSGTFAHATLSLNSKDGGNRRFVIVQYLEEFPNTSSAYLAGFRTIPELSRERIARAGKNIVDGILEPGWSGDIGFRSFDTDTTNMRDVYSIPDDTNQLKIEELSDSVKRGRTTEDLLFQVLLDWGLDLSMPIVKDTIDGSEVFFVEDDVLAACFDDEVSLGVVREMAKHQPLRAVFRDDCFADDAARVNAEQIFRELSPATEVKAI